MHSFVSRILCSSNYVYFYVFTRVFFYHYTSKYFVLFKMFVCVLILLIFFISNLKKPFKIYVLRYQVRPFYFICPDCSAVEAVGCYYYCYTLRHRD